MEIKGVIHVHSTYSYDGKESLESLRDFLVTQGLSFCCLTEHTDYLTIEQAQRFAQECKALATGTFVFVPGFEVPYLPAQAGKNWAHILMIGTEVFLGQVVDRVLLKKWSEASVLTILAHPVRNNFIVDESMEEVLDGVEIWNQQYEGKLVPRHRSVRLLQKLQKNNQALLATCGTDFHRKEHFGAPLYTLEVENITASAVLTGLSKGAYTFGSDSVQVSSLGIWRGKDTFLHQLQSAFSISVIVLGKTINALLAYCGFSLPKSLKRFIRSKV